MNTQTNSTIAVLGAGSWGTALAIALTRNHFDINLWDRNAQLIDQISATGTNQRYIPGIQLPASIHATANLEAAVKDALYILLAVPSRGFRTVLRNIAGLPSSHKIVWASKGLEPGTGKFLHEMASEELAPNSLYAAVSGPSFALEVARGLPTAVTVASSNSKFAEEIAATLHSQTLRTYTSNDIIGVALGGAVKNVLAIAAGIADGLGFGANTRAALITRGLAEIIRLGEAMGGRQETFMGLTGVGDLVLTCTDDQSRNRRLGLALGRGDTLATALETIGQAVEGVHTAREVAQLAEKYQVDMPIVEQVDKVLNQNRSPAAAVKALLTRDSKAEVSGY